MSEWTPLRVTLSIIDVEGDNQYFDPGRYVAHVKLNSGANVQLDLADPENSGTLYLRDQFDTLRISLKDKSSTQNYGSVSFDAEMFREHPVAKQWIALFSSSLSDNFKGEIGRDQRNTPRIQLGYDALPHTEGESRGRTTSKRTKETSQQDRGSHDSRKRKSARSNPGSGKLVIQQNKSRVVSQRDKGATQTTKVEKQFSSSSRGSPLGASAKGSQLGASTRGSQLGASAKGSQLGVSKTGSAVGTSSRRVTKRTSQLGGSIRSPKVGVVGGLEHDETEREVGSKTQNLISAFLKETAGIQNEENRMIQKLKIFERSNAKLDQDEADFENLRIKAEKDLETIKNEAVAIQREEQKSQQDLLRELERLEQEHADIEARLEEEKMANMGTQSRKVTKISGIDIDEEEEINAMKQETDLVLGEIKDAVRNNQIVIEESSFDPLFREDLERHANDIIEKERRRYEIEQDIINMEAEVKGDTIAAEINEASLAYQRSQRDALHKEYNRVTGMYEGLSNEVRQQLEDELQQLDELRDYYRRLEDDRDHFRLQIDNLKIDPSMTYSLDAGSGPAAKFGRSHGDNPFGPGGHDDEIKRKLREVDEAEKARREAEIELDRHYDQWRGRIDRACDDAYVKLTSPEDRRTLDEIRSLIIENDKVTRSLNQLISEKERLENLLYIRKTNHKLTSTVKVDEGSFQVRMSSIKKEDKELMDELNKSDNALLSKNTALRELDDKIRVLSRKYADLEAEAQEKKGLISSLRVKHDHIRLEIERLRGLINEDELARLELDLRQKEARLRDLQAQVDEAELVVVEWREKIILKQRLVKSRMQSRVLLFEPDPNDPVDQKLADYVLSHVTTVPVKKLGKNKFLFGTRNIDIIHKPQGLMVKMINGELLDLDQFIAIYHDKELQKLDQLGDNEELVVDEKDEYRYQDNIRLHGGASTARYGETSYTESRMGETFHGYDALRESEFRDTRARSNRHF